MENDANNITDKYLASIADQIQTIKKIASTYVRPVVVLDFFPEGSINILYMRLRNIGRSPAKNIRVNFDKPIKFRNRDSFNYQIFNGYPILAPGEAIKFFFNTGFELLGKDISSSKLSGRIYYSDISDFEFDERFHFDAEVFRNLALIPDSSFEHNLTQEIKNLRESIKEIERYYRDVNNEKTMELFKHLEEIGDGNESKTDNNPT